MGILSKFLGSISTSVGNMQSAEPLKAHKAWLEAQLADAKKQAERLEAENSELKAKLAAFAGGAPVRSCSRCGQPGTFVSERKHPTIGRLSPVWLVAAHCESCGHDFEVEEDRTKR